MCVIIAMKIFVDVDINERKRWTWTSFLYINLRTFTSVLGDKLETARVIRNIHTAVYVII